MMKLCEYGDKTILMIYSSKNPYGHKYYEQTWTKRLTDGEILIATQTIKDARGFVSPVMFEINLRRHGAFVRKARVYLTTGLVEWR